MEYNTLGRKERLHGDKAIRQLFNEGHSGFIYPFRFFYSMINGTEDTAAILVSVPKKSFKRAVKRNLLKRRIREAYRLNKATINAVRTVSTSGINIAFIYAAKEVLDYTTIEVGMKRVLAAISKETTIVKTSPSAND